MKDLPAWLQDTIQPGSIKTESKPPMAEEKTEAPSQLVLGVGDLNAQIKNRLEQDFTSVWVKGEISNFVAHRSGHYYFSLKEKDSQISAVMFKGAQSKLKFVPENGMEVIVQAKISVYSPRGTYQLLCQSMEPVGAGAMQKSFEQLKQKLKAEGLFDSKHKKTLPKFPKKIAVITSPTGAAIRDIINVLSRRAKGVEVILIPAQVQGDKASTTLVSALEKTERIQDIDVVIIGRGGGSTEDLWPFNNEALARKIFSFSKPIVSAVGHEIDFSISDFVADLRAPTPSAAAELVVANTKDVVEKLHQLKSRLHHAQKKHLQLLKQKIHLLNTKLVSPEKFVEQQFLRLDELDTRLQQAIQKNLQWKKKELHSFHLRLPNPKIKIQNLRQKKDYLSNTLNKSIKIKLERKKQVLSTQMSLLDSLSPLKVLDRGFAIVKKENKVIKQAKELKIKNKIEIQFNDRSVSAEVTKVQE